MPPAPHAAALFALDRFLDEGLPEGLLDELNAGDEAQEELEPYTERRATRRAAIPPDAVNMLHIAAGTRARQADWRTRRGRLRRHAPLLVLPLFITNSTLRVPFRCRELAQLSAESCSPTSSGGSTPQRTIKRRHSEATVASPVARASPAALPPPRCTGKRTLRPTNRNFEEPLSKACAPPPTSRRMRAAACMQPQRAPARRCCVIINLARGESCAADAASDAALHSAVAIMYGFGGHSQPTGWWSVVEAS